MIIKCKPVTPLPWRLNLRRETQIARYVDNAQNASYRDHAANAYPRLVEALRDAIKQAEEVWVKASSLGLSKSAGETARKYGNLLRELGEE